MDDSGMGTAGVATGAAAGTGSGREGDSGTSTVAAAAEPLARDGIGST